MKTNKEEIKNLKLIDCYSKKYAEYTNYLPDNFF